jgi:hypothetical protein
MTTHIQKVSSLLQTRSWQYAVDMVAHYANGGSPQSRARSGTRGTERNTQRLYEGSLGECAGALFCGLDPNVALDWRMQPDTGSDFCLPNLLRVDVKTTLPNRKLIWSNNVNDLYHSKHFHVLLSVTVFGGDDCRIDGYVGKREFFRRKQIAADDSTTLEPGTWFIEKNSLHDADELRCVSAARIAIREKCQFEFVSSQWPGQ